MDQAEQSIKRHRWWILGIVLPFLGALVLVGLAFKGSNSRTAQYWNNVYALTQRAASIDDLATIDDAVRVLQEIERELSGLSSEGVDQLALGAAVRFEGALAAARRCAEHLKWMLEHPVRTAVDSLIGQRAIKKLRSRLLDLRRKSLDAYEFSLAAHGQLCARYPASSFATPFPPDVQQIDEALAEMEPTKEEMDVASAVGFILGVIVSLLVGD